MKTIISTVKTRQTWSLSLVYSACGSYADIKGRLLGSGVGRRGVHSTTGHCSGHLSEQNVLRYDVHMARVCVSVLPMAQMILG